MAASRSRNQNNPQQQQLNHLCFPNFEDNSIAAMHIVMQQLLYKPLTAAADDNHYLKPNEKESNLGIG